MHPFALAGVGADLEVPKLTGGQNTILYIGIGICVLGLLFGLWQFLSIRKMKAHKSMLDVASTIYATCKTYLVQQGKFLALLFVIIGICVAFYYGFLQSLHIGSVIIILIFTVLGMLGSYLVAWFGMRINTLANSRMAFAALRKNPLKLMDIPMSSGMSIGVLLISVELIMMLFILLVMPRNIAGFCFIGFAVGESLGASALRIAGGIFTKIADIGSDLMKIFFKIKEDDPRNPGVIADCTGDNAGDSVGPTADGFETYGVTGVALISFICLAITNNVAVQQELLTWIFSIRIIMVVCSVLAFYINKAISHAVWGKSEDLDFERPLSNLIWLSSAFSIIATFVSSYFLVGPNTSIGQVSGSLWIVLAAIISCGTLGAALIPEVTKIFTSTKSKHVKETINASREGGASLNILSGFVAGNFSAFWIGLCFALLLLIAYLTSTLGLGNLIPEYSPIFAFGLVAFGFLSVGPVTIAVDSYGPVTDNAQSIYELSLIEEVPNVEQEIERDFGFQPDFDRAKEYLEANDGAGNTFKATAKPVLIGTAVAGATIMIFSLILMIDQVLGISNPASILNILNPFTILGFICGGAVVFWFSGAATQAVSTGAYRTVAYIKENIQLDENASHTAAIEKSKEVVKICTQYAQRGMINIFIAVFSFALAFAFLSAPATSNTNTVSFFISYLIALAVFGLFQAVFMANAGGCWDNAKKGVEVDLNEKGTPLHDATVVGDTVGDPFKDTSSVSLNPIIKFTTLFGTLAMEIAIAERFRKIAPYVGVVFLLLALVFVWRSFYAMRIASKQAGAEKKTAPRETTKQAK